MWYISPVPLSICLSALYLFFRLNLSSDPSGTRSLPFRSLSYPLCTHSSSPILHKTPFILPLPQSTHPPNQHSLPPLPPALRLNPSILSSPCSTPIQSLHPAATSFPPFVFFKGSFESLLISIHHLLIAWDVCITFRDATRNNHSFQSLNFPDFVP